MKFNIITLFPEMFAGPLSESILARAAEQKLIEVEYTNLRDFGLGTRKQVDDTPYGGGAGMVLRVDVVAAAIAAAKLKVKSKKSKVILMTPQGKVFNQPMAERFAREKNDLILVCGHYEGYDERIRALVDEEISIGEYVLTGGEIPAMVIVDAVSRLLPGVLGAEESLEAESFSNGRLLEYPQYTRPEDFEGKKVPEVLLSGNHAKIAEWRTKMAEEKTKNRLENGKQYW